MNSTVLCGFFLGQSPKSHRGCILPFIKWIQSKLTEEILGAERLLKPAGRKIHALNVWTGNYSFLTCVVTPDTVSWVLILVISDVSKYIAVLTVATHDSWHFNLFSGQTDPQPESSPERSLLQSHCHPPSVPVASHISHLTGSHKLIPSPSPCAGVNGSIRIVFGLCWTWEKHLD